MLLMALMLAGIGQATADKVTVLTEDFSGATNIFGVTNTTLTAGQAAVYDTKLSGFDNVLAVCNTTAEGTIANAEGQPIAIDGIVTAEWDAFHGYFSGSTSTTVSLLNSNGEVLASYTYAASSCTISAATIGGESVPNFASFGLQNQNGFGGNGKPYTATGNPHISMEITARGGVTMVFSKNGSTVKTLLGSIGNMKKDVAKIVVKSSVNNTDRCYAIDNIKVSTEELAVDPNYVEAIASVAITGADKMTFGPTPDEAYSNPYTVTIVGTDGTIITEDNISEKVTDFKVTWDIEGFKTENDTEGQYCDSYGAFSVNNAAKAATTFELRNVPMNFFGKMTATITYNGTTHKAQKYVLAQGDLTTAAGQVLPLAGYPADFSSYPAALAGYTVTKETYGGGSDLIAGGWCVAGSDSHSATLMADQDGRKYIRVTSATLKKSHVMTKTIDAPKGQLVFSTLLRFNNAGAVVTLTSGYPFWSSSKYTCPVSLNFNGSKITLNGTTLNNGSEAAQFSTAAWYQVVMAADKTTETCYAMVYTADGQLLGESGIVKWAETSNPTFFSIGMGNNNTGSVDMGAYSVYEPTADTETYKLEADKTTLSIPQKEQAQLTASLSDKNGYPIIGLATWSVVEEDMQQGIIITPDANDSHKATVSMAETAEAGTATVLVNIGGSTKTIELTVTSSAESIKFTKSTTGVSIPMDASEVATAEFAAIVIDGEGNDMQRTVTLAAYDKSGTTQLTGTEGISFDAATGILSVSGTAAPMQLTIRATGTNTNGETLTKSVSVNVHGMKFDFGTAAEGALAEGFTAVEATTTYNATFGYGIKSGTVAAGGSASATDATSDYLEGDMQFDIKVQKGNFYTIEITYQGKLTTGYINSDLAGYELGTNSAMATATYTIPATTDVIDLHIAASGDSKAQIAQISVTKQAPRQKRGKRVVHHVGDSTSANNGSWAYRLKNIVGSTFPELDALCEFQNNGAGGRNLSTYYTQGKLAGVLRDIYPDDILMFGNNGTNGMGNSFEADMNYYLDAAEALGAKIIINSYTPHGAVSSYAGGYNQTTNTFDSYRKDSYETIVRRVAEERKQNDDNYLGFVEIGKNADAIFNAYVADYAANGHASADAAAQAIISCFTDHNHYSNGTLACDLMLGGYSTCQSEGIVAQLVALLKGEIATAISKTAAQQADSTQIYSLSGQKVSKPAKGLYIIGGKKVVIK